MLLDILNNLDLFISNTLDTYGNISYFIFFVMIYTETAFVLTSFLPGNSLVLTLGALSSIGRVNIVIIFPIVVLAAILGDNTNYTIGRLLGDKLINKIDNKYITKAEEAFRKYELYAILFSRILPMLRNFIPLLSGISKIKRKKFIRYNATGIVIWATLFLSIGYFLGNLPIFKGNIIYIVLIILAFSLFSMIFVFIKNKYFKK